MKTMQVHPIHALVIKDLILHESAVDKFTGYRLFSKGIKDRRISYSIFSEIGFTAVDESTADEGAILMVCQ
jgi:hypothetical protein